MYSEFPILKMHSKSFTAAVLLQTLAVALTSASLPYYNPFLPAIGSAPILPPAIGPAPLLPPAIGPAPLLPPAFGPAPLLPPAPAAVLPVVPKFVKIIPPSVPPHAYSVNIVTRALTPPSPVLLPPYAAALPPPLPAAAAPLPQPFFPPYAAVPSSQPFLPYSPYPFWRR